MFIGTAAKRFSKSGELPRISPAVDVYNVVSLPSMLPVGRVRPGRADRGRRPDSGDGGEPFEPIGRDPRPEEAVAGEVIYRGDNRVLTRRWNHRDSGATAITEPHPRRGVPRRVATLST